MAHLKRQKIPRKWPIPRKGTKFVVKPKSHIHEGVPLLIILRDMLKVAQNRKEVKRALHEKNILHNSKLTKDERNSILLFDTITLVPSKKSYKLDLSENRKFIAKEIKENEADKKVSKVINKKVLKGKKMQLNLSDGRNFLTDMKCNINDSVLIDLKNKKIEKCVAIKEKAKAVIFGGKHAGKKGIIIKIDTERKMAKLKTDKEELNVLIKQLIVVE